MIGITNKVRMSEKSKPQTTTIPNETRLLAPAPKANAIGIAPNMVAKEVIRMGRKRAEAASKAATRLFKPAPPVLKSAPLVELSPARSNKPKNAMPELALSAAPSIPALNLASSVKPRAASVSKVLPPASSAPSLNETGTLNVNRLSGSRNRNSIMNNEQDEAFEKVVVAVVRIIFGDDNLTEMNVRLVRIALERYNVHEMINSPVVV